MGGGVGISEAAGEGEEAATNSVEELPVAALEELAADSAE